MSSDEPDAVVGRGHVAGVVDQASYPGTSRRVLVVVEVMCTVNVLAASVVSGRHRHAVRATAVNTPAVIAQLPSSPRPGAAIASSGPHSSAACRSASRHRVPAPALQTVIVNPIGSPAIHLEASAVFKILMSRRH